MVDESILRHRFEDGIAVIEATGKHKICDVVLAVKAALDNPSAMIPLNVVIDIRKRIHSTPCSDDIEQGARIFSEISSRLSTTRALVAANDLDYAMGRLSGIFAKRHGHAFMPFRDLDSAMNWISRRSASETPIQYKVDSHAKWVYFRHLGKLNLGGVENIFDIVFADPNYQKSMNILHDMRLCDIPDESDYRNTSSKIRIFVARLDGQLESGRVAIVTKNGHDYAKFHQFIVALRFAKSGVERKGFREIERAMEWLGIDVATV